MELEIRNILITGGAGFIGSALANALLKNSLFKIRVLDNFSSQVHSSSEMNPDLSSNPRVEIIRADIRDREAMESAIYGIDTIVHLAAETGTGQSMYEIERYFSVNVQGTALLLDILQNHESAKSVRSVLVASSRAVYGEGAYFCETHGLVYPRERIRAKMEAGEFNPSCPHCNGMIEVRQTPEDSPFLPLSIYGLTKQVQEQAVLILGNALGINAFALRYQNVYGPGQSLKNPYTGILAVFSNLARQNQEIELYEDGLESRDFVYIDDVIDATIKAINYKNKFVGALNVGSGGATSVKTIAEEINLFFKNDRPINVTGGFRTGDIRHNIADLSLIKKILGFQPEVPFREGLSNFLNWAASQKETNYAAYLHSVNELNMRGLMGHQRIDHGH